MQSNHTHVRVRMSENVVEVDLTRTAPIPAEERLAQTQEGRAQLRQIHQALFAASQDILKRRLEALFVGKIHEMLTDLDPISGTSTIVIRINEAICIPP